MAVEIRPCRPEELKQGISPIFHFFGRSPTDENAAEFARLMTADRVHAAWEDGAVVGAAGSSAT